MKKIYFVKFFFGFAAFLSGNIALSQSGLCPDNLDFEQGDFSGWECRYGSATTPLYLQLPNIGIQPGRHTIITAATAGFDPFGFFPELCPNGSGFSVKLGNHQTQTQAESISYTYTIPATLTVFSMLFYYAVVIESPGHTYANQPRFQARIIDVASNTIIPCVDFNFIADSIPGGFRTSPIPGNLGSPVLYKDWTPISINLNAYIGRTIKLEFITRDCLQSGHAGYAYLDVSTLCNGAISGSNICPGGTAITLSAPFGFQSYEWYSDLTFSTILSNTQTLYLNPPPTVGSIFPVIVDPYPGFGCVDTLYATISIAPIPVADAGPDRLICGGGQASIGSPPLPGYVYSWSPTTGLSNPNIATPVASPAVNTQYILTATDILTGCSSKDTVDVTVDVDPPSSFSITSNPDQCFVSNNFSFTHSNPSSFSYVWDFGDGSISTAQSPLHSYPSPGTYSVKLVASTAIGCKDSTARNVIVYPMPTGNLNADSLYICEGFPTLITATGGIIYRWYRDGILLPADSGAVLKAVLPGVYTAEIISANGCKSAAGNSITMGFVKKPVAGFSYDKYCIGLPINFLNNSIVNGSLPVNYLWDFGNGNTSSQFNTVFIFDSSGNKLVKLSVTPQACSNLIAISQKNIPIEKPRTGINYYPLNAVENKPLQLMARNFGRNYIWTPSIYLSNPVSAAPVFNGVSERFYTVSINTISGCTTIDSQLVRIFKEADIIVPKAFTPNGDGRNDRLYPFLAGINKLKYFRVINRWGVLMFEAGTDIPGWDGTINGKPQPVDGYVWEAEGTDAYGNTIRRRGTVTLIR